MAHRKLRSDSTVGLQVRGSSVRRVAGRVLVNG